LPAESEASVVKVFSIWVAVLAGLLACSTLSRASVTRGSPLNGSTSTDYPSVGLFGDVSGFYGSATAVHDGHWVLTARHCVTTNLSITGSLKAPSQLRFRAGSTTYVATEVCASFGADIAIVRLASPVPVYSDLWSVALGDEIGMTFTAVGYGGTDSNGDGAWGPGGFGTKRMFQNKVDAIQTGPLLGQGTVLRYDFDKSAGDDVGDYEGLAGPGDSGGAVFLPWSDSFRLAGIISSSGSPIQGATGSNVRIADYYTQIMAIVPEPGSALSILVALVGLTSRRGRQR
jgi:hypothetical protein